MVRYIGAPFCFRYETAIYARIRKLSGKWSRCRNCWLRSDGVFHTPSDETAIYARIRKPDQNLTE